ncbi:MAG TPA: cadherin-like domain-containing protein, partial [Verrucomicrobiota bacterium]|nr:cadherin-like domain-containing protein [Verrucomicrobiota bacterium]
LTPCAGSKVTWSAADGFGAGSVAKYKYAWDQSPTHTWTGAEPDWSADTLQTSPTAAGNWYLHVQGYNGANVENGTYDYALTALAAPTTAGIAGSTAVAIGQVGQVYAVTPAPASGSSFVWGVPPGATITAGGSGPDNGQITVTFGGASGNVTVTETTAGNCVGTPVVLGVTVGPNHAPVAAAAKAISTPKNTAASIYKVKLLAGATDADGDPLSISAAGPGSVEGGAVVVQANDVKYTPLTDFFGSDSFTYTISDGQGGTAVGTVNVTVSYGGGLSPNLVYWPTYDGTKFVVTFAGIPGYEYGVEWSEGPSGMPWTWLKNATAGANGLLEVTDVVSGVPARYYRIVYPSSNP